MKTFFAMKSFLNLVVLLNATWMFLACNKPDNENPEPEYESCGVENLITDLPWLKNILNNNSAYTIHEYAFIYSYDFKGKQVIYLWNSASSKNPRIVFRCDGSELLSSTSTKEEWEEFETKKTEEVLLWQKTPDPVTKICGVKNPLTDLLWLKKSVSNTGLYELGERAEIYAYSFRNMHVFYIKRGPFSYNPEVVVNCDGTELIPFSPCCEAWEEFMRDRTDKVLLWVKK